MNIELLNKHLKKHKKTSLITLKQDQEDREKIAMTYGKYTSENIKNFSEDDIFEYISSLWAMLIWGNKQYYVDKLISDNGFENLKNHLSKLIFDKDDIVTRWDNFRKNIKGLGPAMISEILCRHCPDKYLIWNRRALASLAYLEVKDLPIYNYQVTGKKYKYLCDIGHKISKSMKDFDIEHTSLLDVDFFFYNELQVEDNLTKTTIKKDTIEEDIKSDNKEFIHNEVRDKLADIGKWLGFEVQTEKKVATGSVVDTIWQSEIGNMGRVIYVFEVQTKGSIDSLCMNLLKATNNPAVQGIVAVSNKEQIEKIKKEATGLPGLSKIKYWDYEDVLEVYDNLEKVNISINSLKLVPESF
ncbi:MAG: hypothetical protein HN833_00425 [Elusimicrobiaceae bacterium]|jgi:hypothetical protein|nr:hypothetical protein [Elusimicrobiaceae bacterium]MBT3954833.1 hypothetical protein [Elusimicrobiaceae bacterium]MBT4008420.1 hypothetical protein [Elusimicrobiaceae bacterium]MBT4402948.1 hypothetical protein [Elusimicrobiaceae bacterium]MBT4439884.1 hypothetical protein [Elusimicrobiaceae bacterium]